MTQDLPCDLMRCDGEGDDGAICACFVYMDATLDCMIDR